MSQVYSEDICLWVWADLLVCLNFGR